MKKLLNSIKYDIKLNLYNKSIVVMLFLMVLIFLLTTNDMLGEFHSNLDLYSHTYAEMVESGENIEELLNQEAVIVEEVITDDSMQQYIENPLRYDYDNLVNSFSHIKGTNIFIGLLENSTLVFVGLLVGVYMIFLITYEFSEKTIKTRLLIDSPIRILLSKLISGIAIITLVYFSSLLISWVISFAWAEQAVSKVDVSIDLIKFSLGKVLISIFVSYLISLLFSLLGFAIGLLLRKMSLSVLVFFVLHLITPSLGKYDYKNLLLTIFNFGYGLDTGKRIKFIEGVGFVPAVLLVLLYVFIIVVISCFIFSFLKKRKGGYV